ncbi:hypothetical protein HPB47_022099 [Ixodes persulcatus]|uniref:Uncharacterized protein n=1 Tax=Ixodes persulcatus TaxID=34615 RepID=A0AC60QCF7_IXOPE|nr:hypothetical protein HPB47_022099 [Ixodes persulcatus]
MPVADDECKKNAVCHTPVGQADFRKTPNARKNWIKHIRFPEKWLFDALCYQILELQICDRHSRAPSSSCQALWAKISIRWVPGHEGVPGNELTHKATQQVMRNPTHPSLQLRPSDISPSRPQPSDCNDPHEDQVLDSPELPPSGRGKASTQHDQAVGRPAPAARALSRTSSGPLAGNGRRKPRGKKLALRWRVVGHPTPGGGRHDRGGCIGAANNTGSSSVRSSASPSPELGSLSEEPFPSLAAPLSPSALTPSATNCLPRRHVTSRAGH